MHIMSLSHFKIVRFFNLLALFLFLARYERMLKNLHSKEDDSSKFLRDFNPMHDREIKWRPRRKVVETLNSKKAEDGSEEPFI